jgi:hypothetical protein
VSDTRTDAERLRMDALVVALDGWHSADAAEPYPESLEYGEALGLVIRLDPRSSRGAMLTAAGRAHLALLRVTGSAPAGTLTVNPTASGASLFYWPRGLGYPGRFLAGRYAARTALLDYAPAANPVGTSGRAAADCLAAAVGFLADRLACLEAEAAEHCRPFPG